MLLLLSFVGLIDPKGDGSGCCVVWLRQSFRFESGTGIHGGSEEVGLEFVTIGGDEVHAEVELHGRDELRQLNEDGIAIVQHLDRADREGIVAERVGVLDGKFRGAVPLGEFIVPGLGDFGDRYFGT